jgi:hypothetical protein
LLYPAIKARVCSFVSLKSLDTVLFHFYLLLHGDISNFIIVVFAYRVRLKKQIVAIFRHMEIRISTLLLYVVITLAVGEIRKVSDRIVYYTLQNCAAAHFASLGSRTSSSPHSLQCSESPRCLNNLEIVARRPGVPVLAIPLIEGGVGSLQE